MTLPSTCTGISDSMAAVTNTVGPLFTQETTDLSAEHLHETNGYTELVAILPHERARTVQTLWEPNRPVNSRHLNQYGGYTLQSLWKGIIPFP